MRAAIDPTGDACVASTGPKQDRGYRPFFRRRAWVGSTCFFLRGALALSGIGIAIGSAVAWMLTRALAGLFLGVSPHDTGVFAAAAAVFLVVTLAAASVPAFRTMRVNPVVALTSV